MPACHPSPPATRPHPPATPLQGLGLEAYVQAFEAQEVDLSVVHMITAEELRAEIGIRDRLHVLRFLGAAASHAAATGARWLPGTGPPQHAGQGAAGGGGAAVAAPPRKQAQLRFPLAGQAASDSSSGSSDDEQVAGRRRREQELLQELFPLLPGRELAGCPAAGAGAAGGGGEGGVVASRSAAALQQATPLLRRSRLQEARGPLAASLWAGAAAGQALAPRIGARLEQRRRPDLEGGAACSAPLVRGGSVLPAGEESRGTKRIKLEALRQELATHEQVGLGGGSPRASGGDTPLGYCAWRCGEKGRSEAPRDLAGAWEPGALLG